jgi:DNA-binding transcriptional LysR family regulator
MVVLPAEHPYIDAQKIALSMVADEKFVSLSCKSLADQITNLWDKCGLKPRIAQEAHNGSVVLALVAAGLGIAVLPSSLQAVRFEDVVWKAIEIEDHWTDLSLQLVHHRDALKERAPASFIACLRQYASPGNVVG